MEYLDLCRMREVGYTSTKLLSVHVRDAFRISTWSFAASRCAYLYYALKVCTLLVKKRIVVGVVGVE